MRADRLVATVLLLQARGRVTAAELADELEISVATARRDLEALSSAGIPVYPQAGRGGGWSLLGGARTDLSGLSSPEAQALFLLLGPAAAIDPAAKSALRKLVRALPATFRADAEAAAAAVVVDSSAWGARSRPRPAFVDELQRAVVRRQRVRIRYAGWSSPEIELPVDPWGLVEKNEVWYLLGGADDERRTFRIDRIHGLALTDEAAVRPADFDLTESWDEVVAEVEEERASATATVIVESVLLTYLRSQFGRQCVVEEIVDEHRTRVRISAPTTILISRQLAGWGAFAEVLGPESVREELARIGEELRIRYPV
jgi:predicted DNA-binding transcriptional regulator YafY